MKMDGRVEEVGKMEREVGRTMGIGKDEVFLKWGERREEYIHSEAERRAKEMAEMLAKPMAESMAKPMAETLAKPLAESLAASKIAQNIVALLAELGSVPEELSECIAAEKREDTLAAWLKIAARADSIEEFQSKM